MDQTTHNKGFNRSVCKRRPLRTLAEFMALVSDRLVRGDLPMARASSTKQIVVTVSQESSAKLGAGFNCHVPNRMAQLVRWMPSAIGHLQGGCAARSRQMLVTVSQRELYSSRASRASPVKALEDLRRQPRPQGECQRIAWQWAATSRRSQEGLDRSG